MKKTLRLAVLPTACLCAAVSLTVPAAAEEAAAAQTGWQTENGKRCYYDAEGKKAVGEVEIEGVTYVFAPNGALQVGWQTVDGKRFYYDDNGTAVFGWVDWRGETYYVSRTNGKLTGQAAADDGTVYQFDEYGVCIKSKWEQTADGSWTYRGASGEAQIDGKPYLFDENGVLKTGWQTAADGITRFYDAKTHEILTGWITDTDGKRFYTDEAKGKVIGWLTDSNGKQYYIDAEKGLLTGWQMIGGKQYKLLDNGEMFTGFYTVNGATYLFGTDGAMVTGFYQDADGTRYFVPVSGKMLVGLQTIGTDTYYFNENGIMQTGVQKITLSDGSTVTYDFDTDGKCITRAGWVTENGVKYYYNPDGTKATAPTVIDGKTYLFNQDGQLVTGWITAANGSKYYGNADGVAVTGWFEFTDKYSYFYENGVMAVSTTVDGYTIDANGSARNSRAITVDNNIANITTAKTVYSVYQNFCSNYRYADVEVARTTDALLNAGWANLVDTTLSRKRGVCYHLAATLDFTFKRAGFTTRIVYAWHGSHHYWVQVLIDGVWWNYDPTYGMNRCHLTLDQQNQADRNNGRPGYTLRGYVYTEYDKRGALVKAEYQPIT